MNCPVKNVQVPRHTELISLGLSVHNRLTLTRNRFLFKHRRVCRDGNPTMVYGGAVGRVEGDPTAGEVVDVVDPEGKFIAWGKEHEHGIVVSMFRGALATPTGAYY